MKHKKEELPIKVVDGKMECPICQIVTKNVQLHFQKKKGCSDKINLDHFVKTYEEYKKQNERIRKRINDKRFKNRQKESNTEDFNLANKAAVLKTRKKKKEANLKDFI